MGLRVSNSGFSETFMQDSQRLQRSLFQAQSEIQTGQRMRKASDNPQAMSVVLNSQSEKRQIVAYEDNRTMALQFADAGYRKLSDYYNNIHITAQEIASNTVTKSSEDLQLLSIQLNGLIDNGVDILQSKFFLGDYFFGGDQMSHPPFNVSQDSSGNIININYVGGVSSRKITISEGQSIQPQLDPAVSQNFATYINNLISLRDALSTGDENNIQSARQLVQSNDTGILKAVSSLSVIEARIEGFQSDNQNQYRAADNTISKSVESDFLESVTRFKRLQSALEGAYQSASIVMKNNIFQYL